MKLTITFLAATLLATTSLAGAASAQSASISAAEDTVNRAALPAVVQSAAQPAFKTYLQGLSRAAVQNNDNEAVAAQRHEVAAAVSVARDAVAAGLPAAAPLTWYRVAPLGPVMRLPDAYPDDGTLAGPLQIVMAADEYEPASFELYPFVDATGVQLQVSDLKSDAGATFAAANLDLAVVKVWYQNGNGWFSYFQDVGLRLVPELLLHDESLIRVDRAKTANYARIKTAAGSREVWISAPQKLDVGFDPYATGFADSDKLQPVTLQTGRFKQFMLTAHAPAGAPAGTYRGSIAVTVPGHPAVTIAVALKVLPFALPLPKTNYDINKDFLVTLMGAWPRVEPGSKAFMPTLLDLRRHNILELGPNAGPTTEPAQAAAQVEAMKRAGFETSFVFGGGFPWVGAHDGTPLTFDELMTIKRSAQGWLDFMLKYFGHTNAAIGLGDEQGAAWVMKTRPAWRIANQAGLKTNLAGHTSIFDKGGYMLDVHPAAGWPSDSDIADRWKAVGHAHVGFYAGQHTGSENPAFVRRQHGLLGYLSNFDMVDNYEFAYGPWNDRATELYKPMVLAYPTGSGLVDTLQWEGFREGIDDIRYATLLRQLAARAIASGDLDRVYAGRRVLQWFVQLDGKSSDLDEVRLEMIERIETLMAADAKK